MKQLMIIGIVLLLSAVILGCTSAEKQVNGNDIVDLAREYVIQNGLNDSSAIINYSIQKVEMAVFKDKNSNYYMHPGQIVITAITPSPRYYNVYNDSWPSINKLTPFHIAETDMDKVMAILAQNYTDIHKEEFYIVTFEFERIDMDPLVHCYNTTNDSYCLGGSANTGASILVRTNGTIIGTWDISVRTVL